MMSPAEAGAITEERLALRARVAKLEEVIQTQNGVVVSGTLKLNEARARVAKLEAALRDCKQYAEDYNDGSIPRRVDAALKDAPK